MAHIPTSQFVKIHGLTSSKGLALNGRVAWVHAEDASTVSERVHVILFPKKNTEVGNFRSLNELLGRHTRESLVMKLI